MIASSFLCSPKIVYQQFRNECSKVAAFELKHRLFVFSKEFHILSTLKKKQEFKNLYLFRRPPKRWRIFDLCFSKAEKHQETRHETKKQKRRCCCCCFLPLNEENVILCRCFFKHDFGPQKWFYVVVVELSELPFPRFSRDRE